MKNNYTGVFGLWNLLFGRRFRHMSDNAYYYYRNQYCVWNSDWYYHYKQSAWCSWRKQYPDVKLILVLPCLNQTKGWTKENVEIYEDIKRQADKVVYTSQEYTRGCMHKRNRHLVDNSSRCICYLTENKGGTFYTVNYAKAKGLKITNTFAVSEHPAWRYLYCIIKVIVVKYM